MTAPVPQLKLTLAALLCLTLLTACAPRNVSPRAVFPPSTPSIRQLALLPVIFNDRAMDRYVEHSTGKEILWHTRRVLEHKGYQVILVDDPSLHSFITPFAPEPTSTADLAASAPEIADAVIMIRIDNFLDAEIYGGSDNDGGFSSGSLDIYATAQLILRPDSRIVWQKKGFGSSGYSGNGPQGLHELIVARDLVDDLFATLPAVTAVTY